MWKVINTVTGVDAGQTADAPHELSGPLSARKEKQKTDAEGNLLYLHPEDNEEYPYATELQATYEDGTEEYITLTPVMIDDGPVYDWVEVVPTPQEQAQALQSQLTNAVQAHLDATARLKSYDGILSAASYAALPAGEPFQAEGVAYAMWRSAVWAKCYEIMGAVMLGQRPVPTAEVLIGELPALTLPD